MISMLFRRGSQRRFFSQAESIHEPGHPILKLDGVSVQYNTGLALEHVSFEIQAGQRIAIVGPNGAGKSTLFKVIAGVIKSTSGRVDVFGSAPSGHICIAYVPQRSTVDWSFPINVFEMVMMGRVGRIGLLHRPAKKDRQKVYEALNLVNLSSMAKRQIGQLSGGQQQRIFIARALAQEAEIMLLDEPMTGLDWRAQEDIFQVLDNLNKRHTTILISLHDLKIASERFDRVMLLNRHLVGFGPSAHVLSQQNLLEVYGGHFHTMDQTALIISDTCCGHGDTPDV